MSDNQAADHSRTIHADADPEPGTHEAGRGKTDFGRIYTAPDPRPYFTTLAEFDYRIPGSAMELAERVLDAAPQDGREREVLDLACSYGINGAILRTSVPYADIVAHYRSDRVRDLSTDQLRSVDRETFGRGLRTQRTVRGIDISQPAIDYAVDQQFLNAGWAEDLEASDPSDDVATGVRTTGLITCTGGVGYLSVATFGRLLATLERPDDVWLMCSVLRAFSFDEIAEECGRYGLVTEKLPGILRQRRFTDDGEARSAEADVRARGLDPDGYEGTGWYVAETFLTRPAAAARELPLERLFPA